MINEFVEKLIDRLEAQPTEQFVGIYGNHELVSTVIECCVECVNQLAEEYKDVSDTNVGKWIPVSERLPEYNKYSDYYESVIVTLDDGRVVDGCYRNMDKEWWVDNVDGEHYSVNATGHVLAWQHLPQPYKVE
jgi:hypothetical protein